LDHRQLLAILVLGIGGGLFWLGKNGLFAAPGPVTSKTVTTTSTATKIASPSVTPTPTLDPELQAALDTIKNEEPYYQTSFDAWDAGWYSRGDAKVDNGKLIIAAETQDGGTVGISNLSSDRFAVEFEFRYLETIPDGQCVFGTFNDGAEKSWEAIALFSFPMSGSFGTLCGW